MSETRRPPTRRPAPRHLHPGLHRVRGRFGAGRHGPHQGPVHRLGGARGAPVDAGHRQGLGHCRVLHAPRLQPRADRPGGGPGPPVGPDPGDPAPDRPGPAVGDRPAGHGRGADQPGLRRAPSRRRNPNGQHLRGLRGAPRRLPPPGRRRPYPGLASDRGVRRGLRRHRRRSGAPRSRLQRGQHRPGGHECGHDFLGALRGGSGHRRGPAVQQERARRPPVAGGARDRGDPGRPGAGLAAAIHPGPIGWTHGGPSPAVGVR